MAAAGPDWHESGAHLILCGPGGERRRSGLAAAARRVGWRRLEQSMEPIRTVWNVLGQVGLTLTAASLAGVLAWRWRGRRAWRREQELKRQWADTLERAETFMARRLEQTRAEHAAEVESLRTPTPGTPELPAAAPEPVPEPAPLKVRRPSRKRRKSSPAPKGSDAPDDLKRIRGVGRVFEARLHQLGYKTFLDIARWSPSDIQQVTTGLDTSSARIERDGWVEQARKLHERRRGQG